jgi:hypothetical protein
MSQPAAENDASPQPKPVGVVMPIVAAAILVGLCLSLAAGFGPVLAGLSALHGFVAHQFYEVPALAKLRAPSQIVLLRWHLCIWVGAAAAVLAASRAMGVEARKLAAVLLVGYALRAGAWIAGGNLPLVPGDSSHYVETGNSVAMGLPSSKHYVESFFSDYPPIRAGQPVLDDWATPLYADVLGLIFRAAGAGIGPGQNLEFVFGLAKGASFVFNLITLPCLYFWVRRRVSASAALPTVALAAVLPVHAIYAGFELRESLVGLTTVLAVWWAHELIAAESARNRLIWAILCGLATGAAILSRNTALVQAACLGLWFLFAGGKRAIAFLPIWGGVALATIAPWAWLTFQAYGKPFYSYTEHFAHTFSWTVHHYAAGLPDAKKFYAAENLPEVARVKFKSLVILCGYSTMILSLPVTLGFWLRVRKPADTAGRATDRLAAMLFLAFAAATLARIADVTQVAQLGRYYMPIFLVMLPTAVRGIQEVVSQFDFESPRAAGISKRARWLAASALIGGLWADPTWAYDASWFVKPFQLHWPGLVAAGDFIQANPDKIPADARVMSWFPWEMRVTSNRITVLMPRSYDARRILEVMDQYGVTHIVWGSFEVPQHVDPETFGPYLTGVKTALGLSEANKLYATPRDVGGAYPVTIYRRAR